MSSSASRLTRKRALVEPEEPQPRLKARKDVLSSELATVQAELEHERSLRSLDVKRFEKEKKRLERKIEFAMDEASEAKALMEEIREESENHMEQLREARHKTQLELRECQLQLEEAQALAAEEAMFEDPKIDRLQEIIRAKTTENEQLHETIESMKEQISAAPKVQEETKENTKEPAVSPGPPAVMKELNRVRIQLAESERKNRQLRRAAEELQKKAKLLVQERETARSANNRAQQLEQQVKELVQKNEIVNSKMNEWKHFGKFLSDLMKDASTGNGDIPPEESKVQRYLMESKSALVKVEQQKNRLEKDLEKSQDAVRTLESSVNELDRAKKALHTTVEDEKKRTQMAEKQLKIQKSQEGVWQREMDSLRAIVKAFDELPIPTATKSTIASTPIIGNDRTVQVQLEFAQEEIKVLKEGQETVKNDLEMALSEKTELQKTHNTVLEKFGKLKDALMAERQKAEQAQDRAVRAEELAGKGSFNPATTRVLHLQQNPLTEALRQEVAVLKRQVQALSKEKAAPQAAPDVDPNKLHQRLKESFKEQIGRFREGVYLMTGFKIDMIPGTDRPRFKLRSVFAEQEQDHLMFQWPTGKDVQSLDLLNTDLAKALTTTPSYAYISKFHSLPAFLASVQLSLFEKQTMM